MRENRKRDTRDRAEGGDVDDYDGAVFKDLTDKQDRAFRYSY